MTLPTELQYFCIMKDATVEQLTYVVSTHKTYEDFKAEWEGMEAIYGKASPEFWKRAQKAWQTWQDYLETL